MPRTNRYRIYFIILILAIAAALCFIWGNSALTGEESGQISGGLLQWLTSVFPFLQNLPEVILRKAAHFSEYAVLGFLLSRLCRLRNQKPFYGICIALLFCVLTANIDETIQLFRPGRGSSIVDVWIDTVGACTGIAVFSALHFIRTQRCQKKH